MGGDAVLYLRAPLPTLHPLSVAASAFLRLSDVSVLSCMSRVPQKPAVWKVLSDQDLEGCRRLPWGPPLATLPFLTRHVRASSADLHVERRGRCSMSSTPTCGPARGFFVFFFMWTALGVLVHTRRAINTREVPEKSTIMANNAVQHLQTRILAVLKFTICLNPGGDIFDAARRDVLIKQICKACLRQRHSWH